jgi:hypothetical protein
MVFSGRGTVHHHFSVIADPWLSQLLLSHPDMIEVVPYVVVVEL